MTTSAATKAIDLPPPRIKALEISDEIGKIPPMPWIDTLLHVGWAVMRGADAARRTIVVVSMPSRRSAAVWVALGAVVESIREFDQRNAWENLRSAPVGSKFPVLLRESKDRRPVRLTVEVVRTGPLALFDGEWAIRVRVIDGPISHSGAEFTWDWSRWRERVLPAGAKAGRLADRKLNSLSVVLETLSGASATGWLCTPRYAAVIIGDRGVVLQDAADLDLSVDSGPSALAGSLIDGTLPQIRAFSTRIAEAPPETPLLVLNGPEALSFLVPGDRSSVVVLLDWSEIDDAVRNALGPWLDQNDPSLPNIELNGLPAPKSWQIVMTTVRAPTKQQAP